MSSCKIQIGKEEKILARNERICCSFTTYLDVDVLQTIREQELQEAALRPLLTSQEHHYSVNPSELYPNVYKLLSWCSPLGSCCGWCQGGLFMVYWSFKCLYIHMHNRTHMTHMHMIHMHIHMHTHVRTHACTHARTHARMHARTHTYAHDTHTHVCTHTHKHTHTHLDKVINVLNAY